MQLMDTATTRQFDRLPPHSVESEMCVLGSLMLTGGIGEAFLETRETLTAEMFFQADHSILFETICAVADRCGKFDAMTIREELLERQIMDEIGGIEYVASILSTVPNAANGAFYAKRVRELWLRRQLILISNDILRKSYEPHHTDAATEEITQWALTRMGTLLSDGKSCDAVHIGEVMMMVHDAMSTGGKGFVNTGFTDLDVLTGGIEIGEMVVVGARPSMGKSILARQIAKQQAVAGTPTLLFSREEGLIKMGRNILSSDCDIDNHRLRKAKDLNPVEWTKINQAVGDSSKIPLWINKGAGTPQQIRAMVSLMIEKHGIKLVVIDYLQRVKGRGENPYQRVSDVSTSLADMFHDLPVAGIVMAQLSRAVTGRDDKRPKMEDVRESGSIEQDADGLIFLHREDYYHLDNSSYQPTGIAELIVAKWRDGARNKIVNLKSNLKYQRFENMVGFTNQEDPF